MNRLIAFGLVSALVVQIALDALLGHFLDDIPADRMFTTIAVWSSANVLVAMLLGGFIAKQGFVLPALILQLTYIAGNFLLLAFISGSLGEVALAVGLWEWHLLVLPILATIVGALAGQRLSTLRTQRAAT